LALQVRSLDICTPRYLKLETTSTAAPPMCRRDKGALGPSEIHHHLLGLLHIDAEVAFSAPLHQVFHLLSAFGHIIVRDASHYCCVIRKLHNMTVGVCEQEGAQHTALGRASTEGDGGGDGVVDPNSLRSVGQEVQDPVPQCGTHREESFCTKVRGMMVLKAEEKSRKSRRT